MFKLLLFAAGLQTLAFSQTDFHLKSGDVVVFYGDSITDQKMYTVLVETYVRTRFPKLNVKFVHSGWGGDTVNGGGGGNIDERLKRDVIRYRPTVMTIMLGMNDGRYRAFDQTIFDTYSKGYEHILDVMKRTLPELRVTLVQPSPYDDVTRAPTFTGGYNAVHLKFSDYLKELSTKRGATLADLNHPLVSVLEKAKLNDEKGSLAIVPDRVHPGWGGHLIMGQSLLQAWNAPALVSSVEIDGKAGRLQSSSKTQVSELVASADGYHWKQNDEALPMPLPVPATLPGLMLAVKSSDFQESMNRQILQVKNAMAGKYQLKINGTNVGEFTAAELSQGINLAEKETPMMKQAREVFALTVKRTNIHNMRWRQLEIPMGSENLGSLPSILDNLNDLRDELEARQIAAAQPGSTRYDLIAQ